MPFDSYLLKNKFSPSISQLPEQTPDMIVVVPCYKEPYLLRTLQSLYQCNRPECFTEVIVVINHSENALEEAKEQNRRSMDDAHSWILRHHDERLRFHVIYVPDMPAKVAGVGLARKIGMDEAVYRFHLFGKTDGIIVGFDADSVCDTNYLEEIEKTFRLQPDCTGASVYYEHPTEGKDFYDGIYHAIVQYELHLRYLNQALRYTGFPYAYHTVGSAFAVRASAYVKQGGMNRRKAGEDFHFLHKVIPLGNYTEVNTTRVVPSPRPSDRVPFGTGASIRRWTDQDIQAMYTYPLEPFIDLKKLFVAVPSFFRAKVEDICKYYDSFTPAMQSYLLQNNYLQHLAQVNANSASAEAFTKRFFGWFDALNMVKFLNYSSSYYPKEAPGKAALHFLQVTVCELQVMVSGLSDYDDRDLLEVYRGIERGGKF